jgi:ppGpp synthetase/RelA/SpoT-type nucleotidyltranferase
MKNKSSKHKHKLKYKKDIPNQELLVAELKRVADELASCDLSMQTIRDIIS